MGPFVIPQRKKGHYDIQLFVIPQRKKGHYDIQLFVIPQRKKGHYDIQFFTESTNDLNNKRGVTEISVLPSSPLSSATQGRVFAGTTSDLMVRLQFCLVAF